MNTLVCPYILIDECFTENQPEKKCELNVGNKLEILMLVREARSSYRTYELSTPKRFICTLRVFIVIDNYIIGIYANTCAQIMECLIVVLINERISNVYSRKDVKYFSPRLRVQIRLLPLSLLSLIRISIKLLEQTLRNGLRIKVPC